MSKARDLADIGNTLSTTEIGYLDGVTSSVQDQLDAKLAYDSNLQTFVTGFTLPSSDGSSGQALVTNGSGTLSFSDAGISTGKAIAMSIVFG